MKRKNRPMLDGISDEALPGFIQAHLAERENSTINRRTSPLTLTPWMGRGCIGRTHDRQQIGGLSVFEQCHIGPRPAQLHGDVGLEVGR